MKKIMFNDRYGLTQAVLEGKKTMTRRIIKGNYENVKAYHANGGWHFIADTKDGDSVEVKPAYEFGVKIAIAQPYKDICLTDPIFFEGMRKDAGWSNKMFVAAEYMPHRIRITDVKVVRLQDISEEDCLREGIVNMGYVAPYGFPVGNGKWKSYRTPQDAFSCLIDRISGKGTWQRNPWVYAYTFELVR